MVKQKIAVIGASHGGHEVALELLTQSDAYDVTVFEAGDFISFMSCGMELYLTEAVQNAELVRNFKPSDLEKYDKTTTHKDSHPFSELSYTVHSYYSTIPF